MEELEKFCSRPSPEDYDYEAVKRFCDRHQDKAIRIGWPGPSTFSAAAMTMAPRNSCPWELPGEVRREAEYIIEVMNVNGGYILAPSQDFEGDVPVENILALYEARKKFM